VYATMFDWSPLRFAAALINVAVGLAVLLSEGLHCFAHTSSTRTPSRGRERVAAEGEAIRWTRLLVVRKGSQHTSLGKKLVTRTNF
jgi:hypothetical protein